MLRISPGTLIPLGTATPDGDAAGGHPLNDLFQQAGMTPWVDQEIAPALVLRVRRGQNVVVTKGGTAAKPTWTITPAAPSGESPKPLFGSGKPLFGGGKPLFGKAGKPLVPLKASKPAAPATSTPNKALIPLKKTQSGFVPLIMSAAQPFMQAKQARLQRIDADPWGTGAASEPQAGGLLGGGAGDTAIGLSAGGVEGAGRQIERGNTFDIIDSDGFKRNL